MKAKCLEIEYEKGWYSSSQNTKKCDIRYEKGCSHWDNGNGWQRNMKSSSYILITEFEGKKHKVFIDRFFKNNYGKLIESRRNIIEKNMPQEIELVKVSEDSIFYKADEKDLKEWLKKCINTKVIECDKTKNKIIQKEKCKSNKSDIKKQKENEKEQILELNKEIIIDMFTNKKYSISKILNEVKGVNRDDIKNSLKRWNVDLSNYNQCAQERYKDIYISYIAVIHGDKILKVFKFKWQCRDWMLENNIATTQNKARNIINNSIKNNTYYNGYLFKNSSEQEYNKYL